MNAVLTTIVECPGIVFEETRHRGAFDMPRHSHDEAHMAYVCAGSIANFKGGGDSVVSPSALLFMPPGETHRTHYSDKVHAFYIRFSVSWWQRVQPLTPLLERDGTYHNTPPAWLAMRMYREFQKRDSLTPLMLEGLTHELLVTIARQEPGQGGALPWLSQARDYLHAHFAEALSLQAVADVVQVHPGHLMRGFRQHYHCTVGDYVRQLRIEHACRLMREGDTSLAQIACALGFSDQSHFSKMFKDITGMTPTQWQAVQGNVRSVPKT